MRLTVYTDYALRVLMYVAVTGEPKASGEPSRARPTIAGIAASYGISRNHLMKVVHELGLAGYLETTRGKNGGLKLARPAAEIVLGEVVRKTEPDLAFVPCLDLVNATCAITPACRLRGAMHQARAAFLKVLDSYTLADLVENRAALEGLLSRVEVPAD
ncbi:Rrf2 family transcriptional regulator [Phenylobacterium soli]|uniref:Rrf2 family transcriptional regulator n=1 Tax=Phenylobacterium soli TaxID=2170551 RepID=A0A328AGG1_9CAUL|nr:Rrf2 family transcriptional regulator [Phenylobacterium soli]RAK53832.1 Rrf2 family transcriptional regulator [Phenylobacterium soli]